MYQVKEQEGGQEKGTIATDHAPRSPQSNEEVDDVWG